MHKHYNGLKTAALFGVLWAVLLGLGALIGTSTRSSAPIWIMALVGVFIVVVAGGPRIGDLLAGGATKIVAEGWVLLAGGFLCVAGAWVAAKLQPGFREYDARNPVP